MEDTRYIWHPDGYKLAYRYTQGSNPLSVVFLGGFNSDMQGEKARAIESWCQKHQYSCLCFDYRAHGQSDGDMAHCGVGDWIQDSLFLIGEQCQGALVLVGSSMGSWILFNCLEPLQSTPGVQVQAILGIASAPDFTRVNLPSRLSGQQLSELNSTGQIRMTSQYDESGYLITRHLLEEAESHLILDKEIHTEAKVALIHGDEDVDIHWASSQKLFERIRCPLKSLVLVQGGDHRLSNTDHLDRVLQQLEMLCVDTRQLPF